LCHGRIQDRAPNTSHKVHFRKDASNDGSIVQLCVQLCIVQQTVICNLPFPLVPFGNEPMDL